MLNKIKKICFFLAGMVFLFSGVSLANMDQYTSLPPFISADVKANVIFVMDYSGSMQGPANYGTEWDGYTGYRVADYGDKDEVHADYDNSTKYYGYFDSEAYYEYDSAEDCWELDEDSSYSNHIGDVDSLSGNLLNFLVMTRVDVSLKTLIGGKADCPNNKDYCILEPKGSYRWVTVDNLNFRAAIWPEDWDIRNNVFIYIENDGGSSSEIDTFNRRYARVKIDKEARTGIVQENFDKVRFGFIPYSTQIYWPIKHGVQNTDMENLISQLEDTIPYNGTPTGEALREAYRYLRQSDLSGLNSDYDDPGGEKDPYYEENSDGELEAAWCRKSFVVLISDGEWNGDIDPDEYAYKLHTEDLRESQALQPAEQAADVFSLFAFSDDERGENSMKTVAAYGNFEEMEDCGSDWPYTFGDYENHNSKNREYPRNSCNPSGTYEGCCAEWDKKDENGVPDAYFAASNGQEMADALSAIFSEIRQGVASGTSVTALTAKETTGSLINQAAFYPEKEFGDNKVLWTGDIFGDWYLNARIDGNAVQNIREDYPQDYDYLHGRGNLKLDVAGDNILKYLVEQGSLRIESYTPADNGTVLTPNNPDQVYTSIEDVHSLYSCGEKLRDRNATARDIYSIDEGGNFIEFSQDNGASFESLLGTDWTEFPSCLVESEIPRYDKLIRYVRGEHIDGCRSRATGNGEWKLGDIIYSTPVAVEYDDYSMLYAGGNDGMLHAFRAGYMKNLGGEMQPAQLCSSRDTCSDGPNQPDLGREEWAFIPQDSLPYLRYTANPDYSHIYSVDLKPFLIQAGDRKILVGGMRFGGACGNGDINPPADTAPVGRSAYYALDITDPQDPEYLWSFAPKDMGFTYSGPAYVKRESANGTTKRYVMFASGPTGYDGTSEQNLRIYTVDLLDGPHGYNATHDMGSSFKNSFGGRLFKNGLDVNDDGQTDFVLLGYTGNAIEDNDGGFTAATGGIVKIYTGSDNPEDWEYSKFLGPSIQNPITAPIVSMECFPDKINYPYIYFGTGRYFVSDDKTESEGGKGDNKLYGVPFTCNSTNDCSTISSINDSSALECSDINSVNQNPNQGSWKVALDEAGGAFYRERCYSTPSTTNQDIVFFSTNMPTSEICECGGQSRSWALNCASGWSLQDDSCDRFAIDTSEFKFLVQLSGGDIKEYGADAFSEEGGRATPYSPGVSAEEGGIPSFSPGALAGKIIYWREW